MTNIQIIQGDFEKKLKLQFAPGIRAGFPSPAEDYNHDTLDFNRDLIRNPEATFYGKVEGDSMIEAGINDGDCYFSVKREIWIQEAYVKQV